MRLKEMNSIIPERIVKGANYSTVDKGEEDGPKLLARLAQKRLNELIIKCEQQHRELQAERQNRSIIKVNNQVHSLDPLKIQKEIYGGRYQLKISTKLSVLSQHC